MTIEQLEIAIKNNESKKAQLFIDLISNSASTTLSDVSFQNELVRLQALYNQTYWEEAFRTDVLSKIPLNAVGNSWLISYVAENFHLDDVNSCIDSIENKATQLNNRIIQVPSSSEYIEFDANWTPIYSWDMENGNFIRNSEITNIWTSVQAATSIFNNNQRQSELLRSELTWKVIYIIWAFWLEEFIKTLKTYTFEERPSFQNFKFLDWFADWLLKTDERWKRDKLENIVNEKYPGVLSIWKEEVAHISSIVWQHNSKNIEETLDLELRKSEIEVLINQNCARSEPYGKGITITWISGMWSAPVLVFEKSQDADFAQYEREITEVIVLDSWNSLIRCETPQFSSKNAEYVAYYVLDKHNVTNTELSWVIMLRNVKEDALDLMRVDDWIKEEIYTYILNRYTKDKSEKTQKIEQTLLEQQMKDLSKEITNIDTSQVDSESKLDDIKARLDTMYGNFTPDQLQSDSETMKKYHPLIDSYITKSEEIEQNKTKPLLTKMKPQVAFKELFDRVKLLRQTSPQANLDYVMQGLELRSWWMVLNAVIKTAQKNMVKFEIKRKKQKNAYLTIKRNWAFETNLSDSVELWSDGVEFHGSTPTVSTTPQPQTIASASAAPSNANWTQTTTTNLASTLWATNPPVNSQSNTVPSVWGNWPTSTSTNPSTLWSLPPEVQDFANSIWSRERRGIVNTFISKIREIRRQEDHIMTRDQWNFDKRARGYLNSLFASDLFWNEFYRTYSWVLDTFKSKYNQIIDWDRSPKHSRWSKPRLNMKLDNPNEKDILKVLVKMFDPRVDAYDDWKNMIEEMNRVIKEAEAKFWYNNSEDHFRNDSIPWSIQNTPWTNNPIQAQFPNKNKKMTIELKDLKQYVKNLNNNDVVEFAVPVNNGAILIHTTDENWNKKSRLSPSIPNNSTWNVQLELSNLKTERFPLLIEMKLKWSSVHEDSIYGSIPGEWSLTWRDQISIDALPFAWNEWVKAITDLHSPNFIKKVTEEDKKTHLYALIKEIEARKNAFGGKFSAIQKKNLSTILNAVNIWSLLDAYFEEEANKDVFYNKEQVLEEFKKVFLEPKRILTEKNMSQIDSLLLGASVDRDSRDWFTRRTDIAQRRVTNVNSFTTDFELVNKRIQTTFTPDHHSEVRFWWKNWSNQEWMDAWFNYIDPVDFHSHNFLLWMNWEEIKQKITTSSWVNYEIKLKLVASWVNNIDLELEVTPQWWESWKYETGTQVNTDIDGLRKHILDTFNYPKNDLDGDLRNQILMMMEQYVVQHTQSVLWTVEAIITHEMDDKYMRVRNTDKWVILEEIDKTSPGNLKWKEVIINWVPANQKDMLNQKQSNINRYLTLIREAIDASLHAQKIRLFFNNPKLNGLEDDDYYQENSLVIETDMLFDQYEEYRQQRKFLDENPIKYSQKFTIWDDEFFIWYRSDWDDKGTNWRWMPGLDLRFWRTENENNAISSYASLRHLLLHAQDGLYLKWHNILSEFIEWFLVFLAKKNDAFGSVSGWIPIRDPITRIHYGIRRSGTNYEYAILTDMNTDLRNVGDAPMIEKWTQEIAKKTILSRPALFGPLLAMAFETMRLTKEEVKKSEDTQKEEKDKKNKEMRDALKDWAKTLAARKTLRRRR